GLVRLEDVAEQRAQTAELLHEPLVVCEHGAAEDVALPAEKLRRRIDREIGSDIERVLERRPEERVVDGDERLRRVRRRDVDDVRNVSHPEGGVWRGLNEAG